MPAVVVMRSMALGLVATIRRKTRFPTGVTANPKKGEADNIRHGFLCLYQSITEVANNGLTLELASPQAATLTELRFPSPGLRAQHATLGSYPPLTRQLCSCV